MPPRWRFGLLIGFAVSAAVWAFHARRLPEGSWGFGSDARFEGGRTLRFALDVDQARREHRLPNDDSDAEVVAQSLRVVESRLRAGGGAMPEIVPVGDAEFEVFAPRGHATQPITELVCQRGEVQFRIVVRPSYDEHPAPPNPRLRGVEPGHPAPWAGSSGQPATAEGFEAFKAHEVEAYEAAQKSGVSYRPSDPRYRLVPMEDLADASKEAPTRYEVVEEPGTGLRFGGEILSHPRATLGEAGHVVVFKVRAEYQKAFGDWTGENVLLPLAIILNDRIVMAPVINEKLTTDVQITLGGGAAFEERALAARQAEASRLGAVLLSGALPLLPRLVSEREGDPWRAERPLVRGLLVVAVVLGALTLLSFLGGGRRAPASADGSSPPPPPSSG
jgi:preprotein translocase subunit SecD